MHFDIIYCCHDIQASYFNDDIKRLIVQLKSICFVFIPNVQRLSDICREVKN